MQDSALQLPVRYVWTQLLGQLLGQESVSCVILPVSPVRQEALT